MKCNCGYSFIADPDDPNLYNSAEFDLHPHNDKTHISKRLTNLKNIISDIDAKGILTRCINILYDGKYKIQNYKLLPSSEQKKIIIIFIFIAFLIILIAYLLLSPKSNNEGAII
ncbi:MAG: hypothetical protein SVZ03_09610 [Spirochaetota bacterium]|nr:hypothetical protein [Spirochaetota bacterium]